MTTLRIATLNVENLFARFRFKRNIDPTVAVRDGWRADQAKFTLWDDDSKEITGALINDLNADVLALQEVEGQDTLKRFRNNYLGGYREYAHVMCIDGNDPRYIDVAILSTHRIVSATSYQHLRSGGRTIFSRDCLEVDIEMSDGSLLTVFNNHFKSMIGGRAQTRARRQLQARTTKRIVTDRFGANAGRHPFIVCGDFNDYRATGSGVTSLVNWNQVEDVVRRRPASDRWTHYWAGGREYRQLDYLLVSTSLAGRTNATPHIERAGLPWRATQYAGPRYVGVGNSRPKASDHCPIVFDLDV
jgi:endonuclease/exonuclease/phosphatase family metal-dependent hydrolase